MITSFKHGCKTICPHCNKGKEGKKDNWCYTLPSEGGLLVSVCKRQAEPAPGWELKKEPPLHDKEGTPYYIESVPPEIAPPSISKGGTGKLIRPQGVKHYNYYDEAGVYLLQVVRRDDGKGSKTFSQRYKGTDERNWRNNGISEISDQILPFLYEKLVEVEDKDLLIICEGEETALALWEIGLKATTNLGGSKKWRDRYFPDIAKLGFRHIVIAPDLDKPGQDHCETVAAGFPQASFLYAYTPESLPASGGRDCHDRILELQAEGFSPQQIKEQLLKQIQASNRYKKEAPKSSVPTLTAETLESIRDFEGTYGELETYLHSLIRDKKVPHRYVSDLHRLRAELIKEDNSKLSAQDALEDAIELQTLKKTGLDVREIFPAPLANEIIASAANRNVLPQRYVGYFLAAVSQALGCRYAINGKRKGDWKEFPRIFYADITPPSGGKTQVMKSALKGISLKQQAANFRVAENKRELEVVKSRWDSLTNDDKRELAETDENPAIFEKNHCRTPQYLLEAGTKEAFLKIMAESSPGAGFLLQRDELIGFFASQNQFKHGKGDDRQTYLELWNPPNYTSIQYKTADSFLLSGQALNIVGGAQTSTIKSVLDFKNDPDGLTSRFLFCVSETLPYRWTDTEESVVIGSTVFEAINEFLPPRVKREGVEKGQLDPDLLSFDDEGFAVWQQFHAANSQAALNADPALAAYLGKLNNYFLVFSLLLHVIDWAYFQESVSLTRPGKEVALKAWKLVDFFLSQYKILQRDSSGEKEASCETEDAGAVAFMAKLLKASEVGEVNLRSVYRGCYLNGKPLSAADALTLAEQLAANGYGRVEQRANRTKVFIRSIDRPLVSDAMPFREPKATASIPGGELKSIEPTLEQGIPLETGIPALGSWKKDEETLTYNLSSNTTTSTTTTLLDRLRCVCEDLRIAPIKLLEDVPLAENTIALFKNSLDGDNRPLHYPVFVWSVWKNIAVIQIADDVVEANPSDLVAIESQSSFERWERLKRDGVLRPIFVKES